MTATPHQIPDGVLPWTRSCFVCGEANPHGLRLKSRHEQGLVVIRYAPRDADRGWKEIVHGGIATTVVDEVMTWAAILYARRACVAAELSVRMLRPITVGQRLRFEGDVAAGKARLIQTRGRILDEAGTVFFEATGKFVPMAASVAAACAADFVEGPDAIPVREIFGGG